MILLPDEMGCVLCEAIAEALFSTGEQSIPTQYTPSFQHQYWASLAGNLMRVHMTIGEHFCQETCAALNQLTRLQRLSLKAEPAGQGDDDHDDIEAQIDLHLPQLHHFSVADFTGTTTIALECPRLESLILSDLYSLESFTGLPASLKLLDLDSLI